MNLRKKAVAVVISSAALAGAVFAGQALAGPQLPNAVSGDIVNISDYPQPDTFTVGTTNTAVYGFGATGVDFPAGESDYRFEWCADVDKLVGGNDEAVLTIELVINGDSTNNYPLAVFNSEDESRSTICQTALVPKDQQGVSEDFNVRFFAKSTHASAYMVRGYQSHMQMTALSS